PRRRMVQPADALAASRHVRQGRLRRPARAVLRGRAQGLRHVPVRAHPRLAAPAARVRHRGGELQAARLAGHRADPAARLAGGILRPRRAGAGAGRAPGKLTGAAPRHGPGAALRAVTAAQPSLTTSNASACCAWQYLPQYSAVEVTWSGSRKARTSSWPVNAPTACSLPVS